MIQTIQEPDSNRSTWVQEVNLALGVTTRLHVELLARCKRVVYRCLIATNKSMSIVKEG